MLSIFSLFYIAILDEFFCICHIKMQSIRMHIHDETTTDDLDRYFRRAWRVAYTSGSRVRFEIDASDIRPSFSKILSMKRILDEHRENSRAFLDSSTVYVNSRIVRRVLGAALAFIRTERPVRIRVKKYQVPW
jgi:hypothetical protein